MKELSTGASSAVRTKSFYKSIDSLDDDMRKVAAEMGRNAIVIYAMTAKIGKDKKRKTLYVGQSSQVSARIAQHKMYHHIGAKTPSQRGFSKKSLRNAKSFRYHILKICGSKEEAAKFEHHFIKALNPILNVNDNAIGAITGAQVKAAKAMFMRGQHTNEIARLTGLRIKDAAYINNGVLDGDGKFDKMLDGRPNRKAGLYVAIHDIAERHAAEDKTKYMKSDLTSELEGVAKAYSVRLHTVKEQYRYMRFDWKLMFSFDGAFED
jgi:predicted GIY-YIG superfamily endonuclease